MKIPLYFGGNKLNDLPNGAYWLSGNTSPAGQYAASLKNRKYTIGRNIDLGHEGFIDALEHHANTSYIKAGDEVLTHLVHAGSYLERLVIHLKNPFGSMSEPTATTPSVFTPATATVTIYGQSGNATTALSQDTTYSGMPFSSDARRLLPNNTTILNGTAGDEVTVIKTFDVVLGDATGSAYANTWHNETLDIFMQSKGVIGIKFDVDVETGCLEQFITLTDYESEEECKCHTCHCPVNDVEPNVC